MNDVIVMHSDAHTRNCAALDLLCAEPFWINWRKRQHADGKTIKEPNNGIHAVDPHDPANHLSFLEANRLTTQGLGIGFVTALRHDFVCIDLDHCVTESGEINALATTLIARFDTYTEFSPSGRGVHLWFSVKNKSSAEMRSLLSRKRLTDGIEVYGYGQFVTVTAQPVPESASSINDCTEALLELYARRPVQYANFAEINWDEQPVTLKTREEVLGTIFKGKRGQRFKILHETGDALLAGFQPSSDGKVDQSKVEAFYIHNVLEAADEDPRMALELYTVSALFRDKSVDLRGGVSYAEYSIGRILGQRLAERAVQQSAVPSSGEIPDWLLEPMMLNPSAADTPHLSADLLPPVLAEYVFDEAERLNVYPELIAVSLIAALGITVGSRIAVKPKAKDDWREYPNLWGFIAAPPGSRKSEAIRCGFAPMTALAKQAQSRHEQRSLKYVRLLETHMNREKELKKALKSVLDKGEAQAAEGLQAELEGLIAPEKPTERRYTTQDATPEALLELAADNPDGLLIFRDELQGIYANLGKQGRENERAVYLEGWDAKSGYRTDRIMRNAKPVERLCLSVFGGTQPGVLQSHVSSAYGHGRSADGFMQRFQLTVLNTVNPPYRIEDRTPNADARQRVMQIFNELNNGNFERFGALCDEQGNVYLRFSDLAQPVFYTWLEGNARKIEALTEEHDEPLASHFAKYPKLIAALALLFHLSDLVNTADTTPSAEGISLDALNLALRWGDFLEQHARAIYKLGGSSQSNGEGLALKIIEAFRSGRLKVGTSQRELRRVLGRSAFEIQEALSELEELGWLRVQSSKKHRGRATTAIVLHPEFARFSDQRAR